LSGCPNAGKNEIVGGVAIFQERMKLMRVPGLRGNRLRFHHLSQFLHDILGLRARIFIKKERFPVINRVCAQIVNTSVKAKSRRASFRQLLQDNE